MGSNAVSLECAAVQYIGCQAPNASEYMSKTSSKVSGSTERIIKKYPNRRLYDTDTSSYVTLTEIKQLVMESEVFVVRDAKTGDDLTRSILLQIILEEEAQGTPMFTAPVLANIIRFYGHTLQGFMGGYLEKNMQALMDMQNPMVKGVIGTNVFAQMQEQMQKQTEQFLETLGIKR
jgi:polyhydroxyalkanoate synthesis repressor PhaR